MNNLTFLGTGTSTGIPILTCDCYVCNSDDIRNTRSRVSLWLRSENTSIVIDLSPDFRQQALLSKIKRLDGVLITHTHNDHISGLDDIRIYNFRQKAPIPMYSDRASLMDIRNRYAYVFEKTQEGGGKPSLDLIEVAFFQTFQVGDFRIEPIPVEHGNLTINGFIINEHTAYLTDCSGLSDASIEKIMNLERVILGAVRDRPHPTHFSYDQAAEVLHKLKGREKWFVHMTHDLSHAELEEQYGPEIQIPYDGLTLTLP